MTWKTSSGDFILEKLLETCKNFLKEELNLVIRKYTSGESTSENFATGIICCAMVLKNLFPHKAQISRIVELCELTIENSAQNFVLIGLFFDELSSAISNTTVDKKVLAWIRKRVEKFFHDNYVLEDVSKIKSYDKENRLVSIGGKNKVYSSAIIVKHDKISSRNVYYDSAAALCSAFKLLMACERITDPKLEEYRQYLNFPLVVMDQCSLEGFSSKNGEEKSLICKSLFYCTYWLRELLNTFCTIEDVEPTVEFANVLSLTADFETKLNKFFTDLPQFYVPLINGTVQNCAIKKSVTKKRSVKEKRSCVSKKLKSIIEAPVNSQDKDENSNDAESLDPVEPGPSTSIAPPKSVNPDAHLRFQMIDAVDAKDLYDNFVSLITYLLNQLKNCRRFLKVRRFCTLQKKGTDGKASKEQTKLLLKILANFFCKSNTTQTAGNVA
uniref:Uncharacterized protein n=1 Tax=Romanomermis culicivorax TaxID=13658 RepID=A0A915IDZ6_ROMCU